MKTLNRALAAASVTALVVLLSSCSPAKYEVLDNSKPTGEQLNGGVLAGGNVSDSDWLKILDDAQLSVKKISVKGCDFTATGTGFFHGDYLITNRHVVEGARSVKVSMAGDKPVGALAWGESLIYDLAWVKLPLMTTPQLTLANQNPTPGDLVADIGFPLGKPIRSERGRVFDFTKPFAKKMSADDLIQVTSEALPGNSGGPLLDTQGKVVGVIVALDFSANLSLAIPVSTLKRFLADLPPATKPQECSG